MTQSWVACALPLATLSPAELSEARVGPAGVRMTANVTANVTAKPATANPRQSSSSGQGPMTTSTPVRDRVLDAGKCILAAGPTL